VPHHRGQGQALVERALDVAGFERTAKVPITEATIEMPPRINGYSATALFWWNSSTPSSITATAVTA